MRNILLLFLFVIFFSGIILNAQDKNREKKGMISGSVLDKQNDSPLEGATIQLFKVKDSSLVAGIVTDKKGEFKMENLPYGKFNLKINYIGYNSAIVTGIILSPQNFTLGLDPIKLEAGSETTNEIEVVGEKNVFENAIDKKIYNVEKTSITEGGTATDVLKNIPSVNVDADGNITLRGNSNVKILINGRPATFAGTDITSILENIPANLIASVEIINNPSSKYEAEGVTGIINIILKKSDDRTGYNGNFTFNLGTKDKYSVSSGLNFRKDKWSINAGYSFRLFNMNFNGFSDRENNINNIISFNNSQSFANNRMNFHTGSLSIDYSFNKDNQLTLGTNYSNRNRNRNETANYLNMDSVSSILSKYDRFNTEKESGWGLETSLNFRSKFTQPKQELTAMINYSVSRENKPVTIRQQNYDSLGFPVINQYLENDYGTDNHNVFTMQSDYYHPLDDNSRLEFGYKIIVRKLMTDISVDTFDYNLGNWINYILLTDNFEYNDKIFALYSQHANKIGFIGYQFGFRFEQTFINLNQMTLNKSYKNDYISFFPSAYLSFDLTNTQAIQLNYTRRINRPNMHNLNPFIDRKDPLNLRYGNPYLKPEYINSFELGYIKYLTTMSFTSSLFYRHTSDVISRIGSISDSGIGRFTFDNVAKSDAYGLELIASGELAKWWNLNANFTYYKTEINGISGSGSATYDNSGYSWTAKAMSMLTFKGLFDLQFSYFYTGKMVNAMGTMDPMQSLDAVIKKDFLDKKLTISLRASDIFNTMKFRFNFSGINFTQLSERKRDSRTLFLNLTFRFGQEEKTLMKRPRKRDDQNDNGGDVEF
jgi:outer membrane receptor protein involved in Fe transport